MADKIVQWQEKVGESSFDNLIPELSKNIMGAGKLGTTTGATSTTDRQPDHIFEENSNTVKNATNAENADYATSAGKATNDGDGNKITDTYNEKLFDVVVRSQTEFEALIASPTWLGAKNVAFVGNGGTLEFTLSTQNNSGVKIPVTTRKIVGFNNAKITVTNFLHDSDTAKGGLWYAGIYDGVSIEDNTCRIDNLTVKCIGASGASNAFAFSHCQNLTNCNGIAISTGSGYNGTAAGFRGCVMVINCVGHGTGSSSNFGGMGFYGCGLIMNCYGKGTGTGSGNGYGYYSCRKITNCDASGFAASGSGYGYYDCSYGSNNTDLNSKTAKTGGTMSKWSNQTND